ncbi:hypothetical protein [Undibacterium terreum]|uniref:hypothetical protein n=1 Tax=Undibacterium terreum TaxID=1224302 RepID=UPI00166AB0D8|nr:hypothetical protein [Undibacterium terreum]
MRFRFFSFVQLLKRQRDARFLSNALLHALGSFPAFTDWERTVLARAEQYVPTSFEILLHPIRFLRFYYKRSKFFDLLNETPGAEGLEISMCELIHAYALCRYGVGLNREWLARIARCQHEFQLAAKDVRNFLGDTVVTISRQGAISISPHALAIRRGGLGFMLVTGLPAALCASIGVSFVFRDECVPRCAIVGACELFWLLSILSWAGYKLGFRCKDFAKMSKLILQ